MNSYVNNIAQWSNVFKKLTQILLECPQNSGYFVDVISEVRK